MADLDIHKYFAFLCLNLIPISQNLDGLFKDFASLEQLENGLLRQK